VNIGIFTLLTKEGDVVKLVYTLALGASGAILESSSLSIPTCSTIFDHYKKGGSEMILFSNGHSFEFMASSGALGYDGNGWKWEWLWKWTGLLDPKLFTSVTKTITLKPTEGNLRWFNPWRCVRFIPDGVVNAVSLSNIGLDQWIKRYGYRLDLLEIPLVVSIFGTIEESVILARQLNCLDLVGLEINVSCPNFGPCRIMDTPEIIGLCEAVKKATRHPIIIKISVMHDAVNIAKRLIGIAEAISINSVPWKIAFPEKRSPLEDLGGGGVSGKAAQPFTWSLIGNLAEATSIPVIGPSVWEFKDIHRLRQIGAKAISFGSVFLRYPWRPTAYIRRSQRTK
jgi:dihydroorotate dehydrogenase